MNDYKKLLTAAREWVSNPCAGTQDVFEQFADPITIIELIYNLTEKQEKIEAILDWTEAYPIDIFPEPDFKKVALALRDNGMTLDSVSASNMRRVLDGIKEIINADIM